MSIAAIQPTRSGSFRRLAGLIAVAAAFTVALVRLAGLVSENAVNLPVEDQWDTLRPVFEDRGPLTAFLWQHGPHRQGLGGVMQWYLYRATAWDVRAEAWAGVAVLALAAGAAVALAARIRHRLECSQGTVDARLPPYRLAWTDAALVLLILSPLHWETLLATTNIAHSILPLLLVFLLAHTWIARNRHLRIGGSALLGWCALFTGFGFCVAVAALSLALLKALRPSNVERRGEWLLLFGLLGLGFVVFFGWNYRWDPAVPGWRFPVPHWWDYGRFMALMFTSLIGWREISLPSTAAGALLLALTILAASAGLLRIFRREQSGLGPVVGLLAATTLTYAALTAIGRLPINIQAAFMWRYETLMLPAFCAVACLALLHRSTTHRLSQLALRTGVVLLAVLLWRNPAGERNSAAIAMAKRHWLEAYHPSRNLSIANGNSGYWVYFPAPDSPMVQRRLDDMQERQLGIFAGAVPP